MIIDPWRNTSYSEFFDQSENVFEIETSDIYLPENETPNKLLSHDKIKSAHFLSTENDKDSGFSNRALII